MKHTFVKISAVIAVICIILCAVVGCGVANSSDVSEAYLRSYNGETGMSYSKSSAESDMPYSKSSDKSDIQYNEDYADVEDTSSAYERKLIKYQYLTLETLDFDKSLPAIESLIDEFGGYISYSEVANSGVYGNYRSTDASLTVRIPADRLDDFVSKIPEAGYCSIQSKRLKTDEITEEYFGLKAKYDALVDSEAKLNELAAKAGTLTELLTIQNELTSVRTEINKTSSSLQYYDKAVSMSFVYITLRYVAKLTPDAEPTFLDKIGDAIVNSVRVFGEFWQFLSVAVIYVLPYLIVAAVIVAVIIVCDRRAKKKKAQKQNESNK
ncbi:MAG: DUF4349 domain-containing protein [Clostridia bacterium]|nr:DUF4349 domain-containing protein [Clostridia bacterium]